MTDYDYYDYDDDYDDYDPASDYEGLLYDYYENQRKEALLRQYLEEESAATQTDKLNAK